MSRLSTSTRESLLQRYLLIWLLMLCVIAWAWPMFEFAADPFAGSKPWLTWLIIVTMFSIGGLLPHDEITHVVEHWPAVLGGTAIQYTAMPLLAWCASRVLQLDSDAAIGLIMVGCVPGAMASNVLTLAARANVSYSVSLTTSATLLSPLVVPFVLKLALGQQHAIDPVSTSVKLLMTVVGPVLAGHLLSRVWPAFERVIRIIGPIIANLAILWIIAYVVGANRERLANTNLAMLIGLLVVNLGGYVAGFSGGGLMRLSTGMRRALTLEVGMQNAGLGTVLVSELFADRPAAAIPTAAYTFGCMLTGTILARFWAGRSEQRIARED